MSVGSVNGAISGLATGGNANGSLQNVDFNTFLKLLVTQLKNQDPLNPMEGTDFTAQIATFSQLEQQIQTNSNLQKIVENNDFSGQALAVSYIGKDVMAPGNSLRLENGEATFAYTLESAAVGATIEIRNAQGSIVKTFEETGKAGSHTLTWDGKNDDGQLVEDGLYIMTMSASNRDGKKVPSQLYSYGEVGMVQGGAGQIALGLTDGRTVDFLDVLAIRGKTEPAS